MSKSIKLKDNNYIDSSGVTHNRELLSDILNKTLIFKGEIYKNVNYDNLSTGCYNVNTFTGVGGYNCPPDNIFGSMLVFGRVQIIIAPARNNLQNK